MEGEKLYFLLVALKFSVITNEIFFLVFCLILYYICNRSNAIEISFDFLFSTDIHIYFRSSEIPKNPFFENVCPRVCPFVRACVCPFVRVCVPFVCTCVCPLCIIEPCIRLCTELNQILYTE